MEPRIQYARTGDGVNIAYGVFGEGMPLLYSLSAHGIGVHYYSYLSYSRRSVDQLTAAGFQAVRYDGRGTGSSHRTATQFSLEPDVLDLEAVPDRLAAVSGPTLVCLATALPCRPVNAIGEWGAPVKGVAAAIPDARLVSTGDLGAAVSEFVQGSSQAPAAARAARAPRGPQTILFTDVEGSTAFTDRMGDAAARNVLREHERITREALNAHGGSEVKTIGDGFMASFSSATRALACAIAIQRAFADSDIRVRIGLNAGEPIAEDDPGGRSDLYGTAVIVAARIAAQAQGGEVLVSDAVRQLVAGKGFLFNDRGDHALKGFEDPVRVFEVRWRED